MLTIKEFKGHVCILTVIGQSCLMIHVTVIK